VVSGATNIVVTTEDGKKYPAQNVYGDSFTDLAVVKIKAANRPALTTGNLTDVRAGDPVAAIGNALGQGISATAGMISVVNGQPQTDASNLMTCINSLKVGQQITFTYQRGNSKNTAIVTLGQSPS
jgi:serine protease Do